MGLILRRGGGGIEGQKKAPLGGALTFKLDPVCHGWAIIFPDWQSWQIASPETAGLARQFALPSCPVVKNVDHLIRVHPDSQISENSVLFLLRIAMARDIAWPEDKIFGWKNL